MFYWNILVEKLRKTFDIFYGGVFYFVRGMIFLCGK